MRRTPLPPDTLDAIDRQIINVLQEGFPLCPRPFAEVASALGLEEEALIGRIAALREIGAITRFGPFLDAAAMGGDVVSRRGLARAWGRTKWTSGVAREHRMLLFERGEVVPGRETAWGGTAKAKGGFSRERIEEELKNGGRMPMWQVLRCRVRYFTEGGVLGSRAFVDGFFERERSRFGEKRESGARTMRGGEWKGVMALRHLKI